MEKISTKQRHLQVYENESTKITELEQPQMNLAITQSDEALFSPSLSSVWVQGTLINVIGSPEPTNQASNPTVTEWIHMSTHSRVCLLVTTLVGFIVWARPHAHWDPKSDFMEIRKRELSFICGSHRTEKKTHLGKFKHPQRAGNFIMGPSPSPSSSSLPTNSSKI